MVFEEGGKVISKFTHVAYPLPDPNTFYGHENNFNEHNQSSWADQTNEEWSWTKCNDENYKIEGMKCQRKAVVQV